MNEWERNRQMADMYRAEYPSGTRVMVNHMGDPYAPVPPGTRGTVSCVDDQSQILVCWDNGSGLALIPGEDSFRKLTEAELAEEQEMNMEPEEPEMRM